ncbi:hypothetical protein FACS18949_13330 [Clostridia bacterium]|nr:hypothetical protein FACS189425_06960 [Clostridia bacterium]GHV35412.1 hypothetical protein FACS18949_13330 [Clostridia bacterium]
MDKRFEEELASLGIKHRRIRVGTPNHNGRVERQHGLDMGRYRGLTFISFEDARQKVSNYNV